VICRRRAPSVEARLQAVRAPGGTRPIYDVSYVVSEKADIDIAAMLDVLRREYGIRVSAILYSKAPPPPMALS
jgi:hypothetical protein